MPRLDQFGALSWKNPSIPAILSILKNPAYAGAFVYGRTKTTRDLSGLYTTKRLPLEDWKIVVKDKYPAYISWETFERIQAMLQDNYAEYDRNMTRGVPRAGAALLHGIVYCGECGHKMVVQYKDGPEYLCTYLHQVYQAPICQYIPSQPIDKVIVQAFFQALAPIELDVYEQALKTETETTQQARHAQEQQLQRLRYQAGLAQHQYNQVDPDNRLVAAELERRWEEALRALQQAEEWLTLQKKQDQKPTLLPPDLKAAFSQIAQRLPEIWDREELIPTPRKKALLRCLIDKVVIHRILPDKIQNRIVWKGGETTTFLIPVTVRSFLRLSSAPQMEATILELSRQGKTDEEIAHSLTKDGYHSPRNSQAVLPNTVKTIRLKHNIFQKPNQHPPRYIPGFLTISQIARILGVTRYWIYQCLRHGKIEATRDEKTGLYLFPDRPETLDSLRQLKEGTVNSLRF